MGYVSTESDITLSCFCPQPLTQVLLHQQCSVGEYSAGKGELAEIR